MSIVIRPNSTQVVVSQRVEQVRPSGRSQVVEVGIPGPAGPPGSGDGSGAGSVEREFTQADLSIAGVLPFIHGLGSDPSGVTVYDSQGETVTPDGWQRVSTQAIAVNLVSFVPISGIWKISAAA